MSGLLTALTGLLCLAMLVAAGVAVRERNGLPATILAAGLVSLLASVLFLILAAPDVAMTEAAIGSGLTTFLFFFVLSRVRAGEKEGDRDD
ncbi:MAG: Na(+)/H(+) antiporter subunit B [Pseudomonadota bacterium]